MFNFDPFDPTDEQALFGLLPDGEYDFLVKTANTHTNSRNGNQSIKLSVQVFAKDGSSKIVDCYLSANYKKLFAHFFRAVGLEEQCKRGAINPEMCVDKTGRCLIATDMPEEGSKYDPKNVIVDFVATGNKVATTTEKKDDFGDSDIPF